MWLYNGVPFNEKIDDYHGFVYIIIDKVNGKKYIGKKSFWSKRKLKTTDKRRKTIESNWKKYYSSSKIIKELIKQDGTERFERHIIALCKEVRFMNYLEVKYQFQYNILEEPNGWYNENINGCWYPYQYKDINSHVDFSSNF